jgi:transposase
MSAAATLAGAAPGLALDWHSIDWKKVYRNVRRLPARIVKALREGRWGKVQSLVYLLTHSWAVNLRLRGDAGSCFLSFRPRSVPKSRRPPMEKYRVTLTTEERAELERLVSAGKGAARKRAHARVLLLADVTPGQGLADEEITAALGLSLRTIERVRPRLVTEGFLAALDHRPQPARPGKIKIKGDVEQRLIELACGDPPRGRCHWTLQLLADELVVLGLLNTISTETVRQALKKTTPSRGSSRPGACRPRPTPSSSGAWKT